MASRFSCICTSNEQAVKRLLQLDCQAIIDFDSSSLSDHDRGCSNKVYQIAKEWQDGGVIDWQLLYPEDICHSRLELPTYPFEHREYWIDPSEISSKALESNREVASEDATLGSLEVRVKDVFKAFLGADKINSTDDFYDLGGDSLLILQVAARLNKDLGVVIPPEAIERCSTAKSLAHFINSRPKKEAQ